MLLIPQQSCTAASNENFWQSEAVGILYLLTSCLLPI
jgi:hypothetical protein